MHSILLATDVAARGLDIRGVDYVVHYQVHMWEFLTPLLTHFLFSCMCTACRKACWSAINKSRPPHAIHPLCISLQLPRSAEVYVHRSGRTARAAASGLSVAMVAPADAKNFRRLCLELNTPDGMEEYSLPAKQLPKAIEALRLARRVSGPLVQTYMSPPSAVL